MQFLWASGCQGLDLDFVESILPQERFREHFKQPSVDVHGDKWHDVQNHVTAEQLEVLAVITTILRDDIAYVLNNAEVSDHVAFEMLQRLSKAISHRNFISTDYDDQKYLFRFYWEIMAGWDVVKGYLDHDPLEEIIQKI
jgi:hypothetical protein